MLRELRAHLTKLTPAQFREEWREIQEMGFQGPTVKEFLENQTAHAGIQQILFGLSKNLQVDFQEMYAEICVNLGFNPYQNQNLLILPANYFEDNYSALLAHAYEAARSIGGDTYLDIYKPMAMQIIGFIYLRTGVEMPSAIRSQFRWGLDNDHFAEKDMQRRDALSEIKKLIESTI